MYLNHLCTDRELIEAAQYAENPHIKLLAERLDDKLAIIQKAKDRITAQEKKDSAADLISEVQGILES